MNLFIVNVLYEGETRTYLAAGKSIEEVRQTFYDNVYVDVIRITPLLDEIQHVMQYDRDKYYFIGGIY